MKSMNRREFMAASAGAMAMGMAYPGMAAEAANTVHASSIRELGKTGIKTSLLGVGTGTTAWNKDSAQIRAGKDAFVRTLIHGYEKGLTYYDLADMYGSHGYMNRAMKEGGLPREKLMLLTKTVAKDPDTLRDDLERFRKEAGTDYFDVVLLHCMTHGEWNKDMAGCMDVLSEAKEKGVIRAHGVSCHNLDAMKVAAELPWVDVMLNRINPEGVKMDGTVEEVVDVLQTAHDNGKGMIGMKIVGEGQIAEKLQKSLEFVIGLGCIDCMTIGFMEQSEIDDTCQRIERVMA